MTGLSKKNETFATLSSKILILGMTSRDSRLPSPSQTFEYADKARYFTTQISTHFTQLHQY